MLFYKIARKIIYMYERKEEDLLRNRINAEDDSVRIQHPFVVEHPEGVAIGSGTRILGYSRIQLYPELVEKKDFKIVIGRNCLFGYRLCILAGADITIGDNVLAASDVTIVSENHGLDLSGDVPYMEQKLTVAPVLIGNNCWIGDKVIILPGVTIGNNVVIGGGSVVTKSIPCDSIVVGNPARIVKMYNRDKKMWEK